MMLKGRRPVSQGPKIAGATLLMLLALAGLACQTLTGREEITVTVPAGLPPESPTPLPPTPTPTQLPPTETPLPVPESLDLDATALLREPAGVAGYTIGVDLHYQGVASDGSPVDGQILGQGWRVLAPSSLQLDLQATGSADFILDRDLTVIQQGDQGYLVTLSGSCLSDSLGGMSGTLDLFLATSRILRGEAHLIEVGVMVNGRLADIYAFDEGNINFSDPTAGEITRVEDGRLAVARDGQYVLQIIIVGRGTSALLSGSAVTEGDLRYEVNFVPSEEPLPAVNLPAACQS